MAAQSGNQSTTKTPALTVSNLEKSFRSVLAVNDVSFTLNRGEVLSIIGPNGSGKTTTMNLITGVLRPDHGSIQLNGQDVTRASQEAINRAGITRTFQNGRVFPELTVADNVFVGAYAGLKKTRPFQRLLKVPGVRWASLLAELANVFIPRRAIRAEQREARARVDTEVQRFGTRLTPRIDDPAFTLSYANRRRTELARALVQDPEVLLLDEPTAGMNQTETAEVLEQLTKLKAAGQTMLLIEHKIDLVVELSDRVIVLDSGRVIADGKPSHVMANPKVVEAYLGTMRTRTHLHNADGVPKSQETSTLNTTSATQEKVNGSDNGDN